MESEHLKRLRQANQDLLQRLRMKQEEIRKRLPSRPLVPASLHNRAATERSVPVPKRGVRVVSGSSGKQMGLVALQDIILLFLLSTKAESLAVPQTGKSCI